MVELMDAINSIRTLKSESNNQNDDETRKSIEYNRSFRNKKDYILILFHRLLSLLSHSLLVLQANLQCLPIPMVSTRCSMNLSTIIHLRTLLLIHTPTMDIV